ncbi:MAG TPA: hypothetical protein VFJ82_22385 [Longimicrobium sp.]|nr:hypothetical protein [Longimicrobium sp.]
MTKSDSTRKPSRSENLVEGELMRNAVGREGTYLDEVRRRRQQCLARIARIPIAALIWGPAPDAKTAVGRTRAALKEELTRHGHVAHYSEDLYDASPEFSIEAQQAADVEAHDIVFSLPDSPGSIAEIHSFFKLPGLSGKIVTFLDKQWNDGYANKSLVELRSVATGDVFLYEAADLPDCVIREALTVVRRLQEVHFLLGRRA